MFRHQSESREGTHQIIDFILDCDLKATQNSINKPNWQIINSAEKINTELEHELEKYKSMVEDLKAQNQALKEELEL